MTTASRQNAKPDYGIDAPRLGLVIVLVVAAGLAFGLGFRHSANDALRSIAAVVMSLVPTGVIVILLMVSYVKIEKFRHRDRMLNMLAWRGDEQVLDIGTGRGLLMVGAAMRLTTGKSVGVDIWRESDMSDNRAQAALDNAEIEGVGGRVEVRNADAKKLPFPDQTFNYVLSNVCLHNIPTKDGRAAACREIARVLKPGGTALISDFRLTDEYAAVFREQGLETSRSVSLLIAPMLLRIVKAVKK